MGIGIDDADLPLFWADGMLGSLIFFELMITNKDFYVGWYICIRVMLQIPVTHTQAPTDCFENIVVCGG